MATLTTVYGANATLTKNTVPKSMAPSKQQYGKLRIMYDSYDIASGDDFGTSGLIKFFNIPNGAFIVDGRVACTRTGTTGVFEVGWAADAAGVETADPDGFFTSQDSGAAAIASRMLDTVPGFAKTFAAECEVQVDWTTATNGGTAETLELMIYIATE